MARPSVTASPRSLIGKGPNRRLRAEGAVPGVVYGKGLESVPVTLDPKVMVGLLNGQFGKNSLMDLTIEGEDTSRLTIIKDYQVHPWKRKLLHVDLWQVTEETVMLLDIPFKPVGEPPIAKLGGKIETIRDYVKVRCKPAALPHAIEYDLTKLPADMMLLQISNVPLPEGVEAVYTDDYSILRAIAKKTAAVDAAGDEVQEEGDAA